MIWKEFYPPPCNKLVIYYNGAVVIMKRFDGKGPTILFDPYEPPTELPRHVDSSCVPN